MESNFMDQEESTMRKWIVALLISTLLICFCVGIAGADNSCGPNLTWILSNDGVLTISGTGEMVDCSYSSAPWNDKKDKIVKVVVEEGVTNIADSAFYWCDKLQSVQLPESLLTIGERAFANCSKLVSVNIPSNLKSISGWAFYSCYNLESLTLNEGLQSVGELAFKDCRKITNLYIPSTLVSIDLDRTFIGCDQLSMIEVAKDNPNYCSIDGVLFNKDMTILYCYPAGKANSSYDIPNGVTKINDYGFYWNENITKITIPETVIEIDEDAFAGCTKVKEFIIPEGVISIGSTAFYRCSSLVTISLPASLYTLGKDMFESCSKLTTIEVAEGSTSFKSIDGVLFSSDGTSLLYYPAGKSTATYSIPNGVCSIGDYAFLYNKNLVSVSFPEGLETIGSSSFNGCKNLVKVDFPSTLVSIDYHAFNECDGLTSIVLPESVFILGDGAFNWCDKLVSVTIKNPSTSFNKWGVFKYGNDDLVIYGLAGSTAEAYASENSIKFETVTFEEKTSNDAWKCTSCGADLDGGKFCYECGAPRPTGQVCSNCGYEVEEGKTMKFCPECGTAFDTVTPAE